jgi:tRNA A-37 threonylcarbamoyl transferase component Bud32
MSLECSPDSELHRMLSDAGLDTVAGALAYGGGEDLVKPGLGTRRRTRIELNDSDGAPHVLYLKRYGPERLKDRWRRFLTYGRCSPASVEFNNIRAAQAAGVSTMNAVAFGHEMGPCGLAAKRSYMVVTSVPGDALERCGEDFLAAGADDGRADRLTLALADQIGALHAGGMVHRDMYAAHVFLHESPGGIELYMIDMARVFSPRWRMFRWRVKDLAQLKYSMPPVWIRDCWEAFLEAYLEKCPGDRQRYVQAIDAKTASIRRQTGRRAKRKSEQ